MLCETFTGKGSPSFTDFLSLTYVFQLTKRIRNQIHQFSGESKNNKYKCATFTYRVTNIFFITGYEKLQRGFKIDVIYDFVLDCNKKVLF